MLPAGNRDGRMMTVRVVMRYLVNKLGLDDDSQVRMSTPPSYMPSSFGSQYFSYLYIVPFFNSIYMRAFVRAI
jgi:hypothetical protein